MAITIWIASFITLLFLVIRRRRTTSLNLPPGSYGWPVVGETLDFIRACRDGTPEKFVKDRIDKYDSQVFKTSMLGETVAVLCGPSGNKFLFGNENKVVKAWWPSSVKQLLGTCVTTTSGDEAKIKRKMLSYFVGPDAFSKLYIKTLDLKTQQHIDTHWLGKQELKVFPTIKLYNFEMSCRLFMSLEDTNSIAKLFELFHIFLKGVISMAINIPGTRFYRAMKASRAIRQELLLIIRQRRESLEKKLGAPAQDLLSHLLLSPDDRGVFMSELEIANNILLLLFASHDTSSVTMTLVMKYLAELPHVYEKVLQEQKQIATSKVGECLEWNDIQKMRYTWNVVSEVMRLTPPILGSYREALVDLNYEGYTIPKGWKLYWTATATHLDPKLFRDTKNFDPSRFEGAGPTPYSYVPFGGGPRMCLGNEFARLEILVFLHNVVKEFSWKLSIPNEKIEFDPMPTPVEGLPVLLQPHNPLNI